MRKSTAAAIGTWFSTDVDRETPQGVVPFAIASGHDPRIRIRDHLGIHEVDVATAVEDNNVLGISMAPTDQDILVDLDFRRQQETKLATLHGYVRSQGNVDCPILFGPRATNVTLTINVSADHLRQGGVLLLGLRPYTHLPPIFDRYVLLGGLSDCWIHAINVRATEAAKNPAVDAGHNSSIRITKLHQPPALLLTSTGAPTAANQLDIPVAGDAPTPARRSGISGAVRSVRSKMKEGAASAPPAPVRVVDLQTKEVHESSAQIGGQSITVAGVPASGATLTLVKLPTDFPLATVKAEYVRPK